jgi:autotransporter-associated beta strand protein
LDGKWGGGFTGGAGTVVFNSPSLQTIHDVNSAFNNLIHSGSGTLKLTAGMTPLTLSGNFENLSGTVDGQGASISLHGNWTDAASVVNLDTVNFNGQGLQTLSTNSSFNNFIYSGNPTLFLLTPMTVAGNLTISSGRVDLNDHDLTVSGLTTIENSSLINSSGRSTETIRLMGGLTLDGGDLDSGAGLIILVGDITANSASLPAVISGRLDFEGMSHTVTVARGGYFVDLFIFATISNGGALTKDGTGILELGNTNTYAGGTFVNAGILDVSQDGALGPGTGGTVVAAGAVLQFSDMVTYNTPETVTLNGGGIGNRAGSLTDSFAGPINLNAPGSFISTEANFILNGQINASGFDLTLEGFGDATINGDLNSGNTLTKQGTGTLTINGTNTFTGGTNVQQGTLGVGNDSAVGAGAVTLEDRTAIFAAGADHILRNSVTLEGAVTIAAGPNTLTFSGNVNGNGSLSLNGNLSLTGTNAYSGGTTVNAATLGTSGNFSLGSGQLILNDGCLLIATNGFTQIGNSITINGSATIGGDNIISLNGPISGTGSLTDSDTARLEFFNSPNTYSGGTIVTAGTLYIVGGVTLGSGPLTLNDGTTLQAPFGNTLSNAVTLNGISSISGGGPPFLTLTGTIGGTGGFMVSLGGIMLTGNTYSGTTTLTGGPLVIDGSQPNSPIIILNGSLSGTGTVGPVTLNHGFIHPGPYDFPGILTTGNLQSNGGGLLEIRANGPAAGTGYGQLQVNGTVTLGSGVTTLLEASNTRFPPGTQLKIIDNLGTMPISGFFSGLPEGSIFTDSAGNRWRVTYQGGDGNDVVLIATPQTDDIAGRVSQNGQWWVGVSNGSTAFNSNPWAVWNPKVTWVDDLTGDFNADGRTDIASRDLQTGNWWVGISNGSGFTTALWTNWNPSVIWVDVQVGDFLGNGMTDIIGRVQQTGQWWVAQSNGSGFTNSLWATWNPMVTWVDVKVGDFNGDGKSDITGRYLQAGSWWTGISNGSTFTTGMWGVWNPNVTWVDVNVGDFDGDGKSDITGRVLNAGTWWTAHSTGSSFTTSSWGMWNPAVTWVDVKVGDFNGDGKDDIIGRWSQTGQWWAAISTGTSFANSLWSTWSTGVTWVDVQVGDFNGDGKSDITARALQTGGWWTGLSNGTAFTTSLWATWSTAANWVDVRNGDFA